MPRDRTYIKYAGTEIIDQGTIDLSWEFVRAERDAELMKTDVWAHQDRTMTQAQIDYRQFLRDLPQNYEDANAANDAWLNYEYIY